LLHVRMAPDFMQRFRKTRAKHQSPIVAQQRVFYRPPLPHPPPARMGSADNAINAPWHDTLA
jgi:hypothetical protein